MDRLRALLTWARGIVFRRAADAEMDEEMRFHLDMEIEHNLRAGMTPAEARRKALVAFGGMERHRETLREHRRLPVLETVWYDARHALRSFRRDFGTSVIAVVVLALGIGLPTVMYSFVDPILNPTARVADGDRLVEPVQRAPNGFGRVPIALARYADWAARQRSFEGLAAHRIGPVNLRYDDHPVRYTGDFITVNGPDLMGAKPLLGRGFLEEDGRPGAPLAVIIGHRAWQDLFDGDGGAIGARVTVNGEPGQVVGIMGPRSPLLGVDALVPLRIDAAAVAADAGEPVIVFGKLADGVSIHEARAETLLIAGEAAAAAPGGRPSPIADLLPVGQLPGWFKLMLYSMLATACMVLLIAGANVANLLLARTVARSRDLAVRTALGASRVRTMMQVMTEAGTLAGIGALLGTGVAWAGMKALTTLMAVQNPSAPMRYLEMDRRALAFVVAMTALATLAAGVLPAWRASRADVHDALKDGGGGTASLRMGRLSRGLVIGEVAMSVALLVASGLMLKGFFARQQVVFPFEPGEIFTAEVAAFEGRPSEPADRRRFWEDVEARLTGIEGTAAVGLGSSMPGVGSSMTLFGNEGETYATDREVPAARRSVVTPGYFAVFGAEPIQGRLFHRLDDAEAVQVVVVNQSFVRRWLGGREAIGRRIRIGGPDSELPWRTIVGVVPDLQMAGMRTLDPDEQAALYTPLAQENANVLTIAAAAGASPLRIRGAVRNAVVSVDAETSAFNVMTLDARIKSRNSMGPFGMMYLAFGVAALFMASVGLYGVISFSVSRRRAEMGIRMALGSAPSQVRGLVLREGMKQVAIGLGTGVVMALLVTRYAPELDQLVGDDVWDATIYAIVLGTLAVAGFVAVAIPAIRATRVDPASALRS